MRFLESLSKKAVAPKTNPNPGLSTTTIYDIRMDDINGEPLAFSRYKGKYILFVNVASKCGFTGQYKDLEKLYQRYKEQLMVVGVPCNQFGAQEPGSAEEIKNFCAINYGVSFSITEKVDVKGTNQHPLYQWLTQKRRNGKLNSRVRWNFQKYLVGPEGQLLDFYYSTTHPLSSKITRNIIT